MTEYKEMTANRAITKLQCEQEKNNTPSIDIAYTMAVAALKKQIPVKVIYGKCATRRNTTTDICPICRYHVTKNWCSNCGQKLDWSSVKSLRRRSNEKVD